MSGTFLGEPDGPHRLALATQPVAHIEKGRGGRTLAFKIRLADGTVGYYKPEQTFSAAHWYAEVASYYLDRELGLGRVPPTIGRRLPWAPLRRVAGNDRRLSEIIVQSDGTVRGAFIWWVPGGLVPIAPGVGWEKWIRVEGPLDPSPYQAARNFRRDIRAWHAKLRGGGAATGDDGAGDPDDGRQDGEVGDAHVGGPAGDPDTPDRAAELSDMILFDYLTNNLDRWGGRYTNVRTRGPGGPLVYLDNGAGFFVGHDRIGLMDARVRGVQRFRRKTVERIRALDLTRFEARLARDPLAPVLDDRLIHGIEVRRRYLLEHVAEMQRRFGDAAMPW